MMKLLLIFAATLTVVLSGSVDPSLTKGVDLGLNTVAILELPQIVGQLETNQALQTLFGDAKVATLVATLKGLTSAAQAPFVSIAASLGLEIEQYWISNVILVKGLTLEKLDTLSKTPGEFILRKQHIVTIDHIRSGREEISNNLTVQNPQWGVAKIRAPEAWNLTTGENAVVGFIDTGVNIGHVALSDGYAGAWMDPYYNTPTPTDVQGHGSFIAGIVVVRANGIGVAPGAQYIACRGMNNQGSGTEAALIQCAEFMVTATPRPQVVPNAWGGASGAWFEPIISAWRSAGIIPLFAIGNSGPNCGTISAPGSHASVIGAAATSDTDAVATFSSRGPGAGGVLKPDFAAPGSNILSAGTGAGNYVTMSGNGAPRGSSKVAKSLRNPDSTRLPRVTKPASRESRDSRVLGTWRST
ncbi:bacillopeptidase F isoform X1 [Folsomia candida]|uniref:bacillopeptidase F isoform X1 n=1 Tax=Folsomia candida TaxID=158441 RepID=UPI001604FCE4|nr:bacillopeptidase F isoform X1 [Folsomia candida]